MAYTPDKLETDPPFGNLPISGQETKMTSVIGSNIQTVDAALTNPSPLTINGNFSLNIPTKALQLTIWAGTTFSITEDSARTAVGFNVPANFVLTFGCFRQPTLYINTGSSFAVNYYFTMLN